MNPESDEWMKYGLEDTLDILNPPEELLHSFSTEELAELMMDYPYLWVLTSYEFDKMDTFFCYLDNCDIYNELMSRDDGVSCLLKEYQKSDFNVNLCNEDPYMVWGYNPMANAEVFGCKFIVYNSSDFDKEEYELCYQVMLEKTDLYSALNDNIAKKYLSFKEQPIIYYVADSADLVMSASDGFTSSGTSVTRDIEGVPIEFTGGIYNKYGVSESCLKYKSGVYDEETQQTLDTSLGYQWYRLSRSSPAYNCHAYAWLNAGPFDGYWLDLPTAYMSSPSSVTYVGYNVTPQVGDIIVMYKRYTGELQHSAIIYETSSNTVSKLGGRGLYIAPLSELMNYYGCDNYKVYRKN